jgi:hypothetical protein
LLLAAAGAAGAVLAPTKRALEVKDEEVEPKLPVGAELVTNAGA